MNRKLTLIAALALSTVAMADDFSLYYDSQTEQNKSIGTVESLQKIVFEDGKMKIIKKDGTETEKPLSDVSRLFFSTPQAVGIDHTDANDTDTCDGIYDISGRRVNTTSVSELPKGLYIIDGKKLLKR